MPAYPSSLFLISCKSLRLKHIGGLVNLSIILSRIPTMASSTSPPALSEPKVPTPTATGTDQPGTQADEATHAIQLERDLSLRDTFKLYPRAIMFSFIISLAVIMEGYDTNLMGNFYPYPSFKNRFGDEADPEGGMLVSAKWQTIIGNSTQVRMPLHLA